MVTPKFTRPKSTRERLAQHIRVLRHKFWAARYTAFVAFMANTIGRLEHKRYHKKQAAGEKVVVDKVFAPPPKKERYADFDPVPADISPKRAGAARKARSMKIEEYPSVDYGFKYEEPPISGNVLNGLGETEKRRTTQPFFTRGYSGPWNKLERLFQAINKPALANFILNIFWMDRNRLGVVARKQVAVEDPTAMTKEVKSRARIHGADVVGVAPLQEEMRFEGFDLPFKYAISIALAMDRETMVQVPTHETGLHIQKTYKNVGQIAIDLAQDIRKMGWPARACTNISPDTYEVQHIPVAIEAGIGMLGKHGSLITKEFGSNVRLATVLTDLPLAIDGPKDIGVDDFCATCQICSDNCPPDAIFDVKQLVRGQMKWYVDFDTCIPYFVANDACGICIEVCPWSAPGRGPLISKKMLERREKASAKTEK
ncbi:MAG: 4Fe-4S dicluster domain-containing protein [Bacteroidota bacterium]